MKPFLRSLTIMAVMFGILFAASCKKSETNPTPKVDPVPSVSIQELKLLEGK